MSAFARHGPLIAKASTLALQKRMVGIARTLPNDNIEKLFSSKIKKYKTSHYRLKEWQHQVFVEQIEKLKKVDGLEGASTSDLENNVNFKAAIDEYSNRVGSAFKNESTRTVYNMNQNFQDFKTKCHTNQSVYPHDFKRTFKMFTNNVRKLREMEYEDRAIWDLISANAYALIISCGRIMLDSNENKSQSLSKVWQTIKECEIEINTLHYNALIKVMNDNSIEFNPETILAELKEKNLEPDPATYQRCILQYCKQKKLDLANNLLEEMKSKDFILNENIFAALVVGYSPNVDDIFKLMEAAMIEPTITTYSAAFSALLDDLEKNPDSAVELERISKKLDIKNAVFRDIDINELLLKMCKVRDNYEFIDKIFNDMLSLISNFNITTSRLISQLYIVGEYETASSIFWTNLQKFSNSSAKRASAYFYLRSICFCKDIPLDFLKTQIDRVKELYPDMDTDESIFVNSVHFGNAHVFKYIIKELEIDGRIRQEHYWPFICFKNDKEEKFQVFIDKFVHISHEGVLIESLQRFIWPFFLDDVTELFELNIKKGGKIPSSILFKALLQLNTINQKTCDATVKFLEGLTREKMLSLRTEEYPFQTERSRQIVVSRIATLSKLLRNRDVAKLAYEMSGCYAY